MSNPRQLNMSLDLKTTTPIVSKDGGQVFSEGVILRKVSRFITGQAEDGVVPIPCFFDVKSGKVLTELLPKELRDEFEKEEDSSHPYDDTKSK